MSLVPIAWPQSESELAVMLCLLEAEGVPAFVHNAGFGGLHPGPVMALYNARRVMVPAACRDQAVAALSVIMPPLPDGTTWREKCAIVAEMIVFGWFFPRYRSSVAEQDDGAM